MTSRRSGRDDVERSGWRAYRARPRGRNRSGRTAYAAVISVIGRIRITPPFGLLSFVALLPWASLPFALPQGWSVSVVLDLPGGGPNFVGQGGWPLADLAGFATTCVGRGVGLAVGFGVGRAVGRGVGSGGGAGVGRAGGRGVGCAGALVGVGVRDGRCVAAGRSVGPGVFGARVGATVVGVPVATGAIVGVALDDGGLPVGATDGDGVGEGVDVGTPVG